MNALKYGCGIDIAKEKFEACLGTLSIENGFQKKSSMQFDNNIAGFKKYFSWITKHCRQQLPMVHLMEASGIYYENLAMYLVIHVQQSVVVVLPNKAKKYKESLGFKSKTDGIDALALSRMACEQNLPKWNAPDANMYQLRLLTRQIESVTAQSTSVKNQLEALVHSMYPSKDIERMLKKQVAFLAKQKAALLNSLEQFVEADPAMKPRFDNIKKIKGVSTLTIATVVAETGGFALFENVAQLVSYAGYDIVENQSGKHSGKTKISKKGNGRIRRCLYFPALSVVRYRVAPFVHLYERIYNRTRIKMKGYTAVQKKLLVIIYTLWKNNEAFDPQHQQNKTSGEMEKESSFISASKKQPDKKVVPVLTGTTQDKHPSKHRSMSSFI
jgi:transposase